VPHSNPRALRDGQRALSCVRGGEALAHNCSGGVAIVHTRHRARLLLSSNVPELQADDTPRTLENLSAVTRAVTHRSGNAAGRPGTAYRRGVGVMTGGVDLEREVNAQGELIVHRKLPVYIPDHAATAQRTALERNLPRGGGRSAPIDDGSLSYPWVSHY